MHADAPGGTTKTFRVNRLLNFLGLKRVDVAKAYAGDIIALAGIDDVTVGETICRRSTGCDGADPH